MFCIINNNIYFSSTEISYPRAHLTINGQQPWLWSKVMTIESCLLLRRMRVRNCIRHCTLLTLYSHSSCGNFNWRHLFLIVWRFGGISLFGSGPACSWDSFNFFRRYISIGGDFCNVECNFVSLLDTWVLTINNVLVDAKYHLREVNIIFKNIWIIKWRFNCNCLLSTPLSSVSNYRIRLNSHLSGVSK